MPGDDDGHRSNGQRRDQTQGQPRLWLQPFLLLALEEWQSHGYELIRRMSSFGFDTLDRGSVYRTLRQMEKDGLLVSGWDTSHDGPARRLYSLTDSGRTYLNSWAAALHGYQVMLDRFFQLHPAPGQPAGDENDETEPDVPSPPPTRSRKRDAA
jgi:PadR family transcriptional regulator, regulatory protein PadR